jgi:hypothetical protein
MSIHEKRIVQHQQNDTSFDTQTKTPADFLGGRFCCKVLERLPSEPSGR